MTRERRAEAVREVCRRVSAAVNKVAPPGLGRWDRAWEMVEEPSAELLETLAAWEATGSPEDRDAVKDAANAVVATWQYAAEEWERAGRPTARQGEATHA